MLVPGFEPVHVNQFGGLVLEPDRMTLVPPSSPGCQNVAFAPGLVRSRGGLTKALDPGQTEKWNGFLSYVRPNRSRILLGLSDDGTLWKEAPQGTISSLSEGIADVSAKPYVQGATLDGRAHLAVSSQGLYGIAPPRTYDGTYLDRFTYGPPGKAPTGADSATAGTVAAGERVVAVAFEMRSGFVTVPTVSGTFNTAGTKKLDVTSIPLGPPGCVARLVFVGVSKGSTDQWSTLEILHIPATMRLADNTSTQILGLDFTEDALLSGEPAAAFTNQQTLPPVTGFAPYAGRMAVWGDVPDAGYADNAAIYAGTRVPDLAHAQNVRFDGGPDGSNPATPPYGWAAITTGGTFVTTVSGALCPCWLITSDGVTANRGKLRTGFNTTGTTLEAMLAAGKTYKMRVRLMRTAASATGRVTVEVGYVDGSSVDHVTKQLQVGHAALTTNLQRFVSDAFTVTYGANGLYLMVYMDTPFANTVGVACEGVEFFEVTGGVDENTTSSNFRVSKAGQSESFDNTTGYVTVRRDDGQALRCGFVLRTNLYAVKERSLHVVRDDGANEPSGWQVQLVSDVVGTYSPYGVGVGDGWVVIAARSGLYYFAGGLPEKLSQEIQPVWDRINWEAGSTLWVVVDAEQKRILCGLPLDSATEPSATYVLDYREGFGDPLQGVGRKWALWTVAANSAVLAERDELNRRLFFGTNDGTGFVLEYDESATDDNGTAIDAYYELAPLGLEEGVTMLGGVVAFASGRGTLSLSHVAPDGTVLPLLPWQLVDPPARNLWRMLNLHGERVGFRVGTADAASHFRLDRVTAYTKPAPFFENRGYNP